VLDTPPDGAFDRITALAARHFDVPIAIVSIVDTDRIWFKSHHGIDAQQIGRDPGLCASAILQDRPWIVRDTWADPRTIANPLVAGELGLRFYAGAPLTTRDGFNLGTVCVIDQRAREFSEDDEEVLADLAAIVMDELELRLAARRSIQREHVLRREAERMARLLQEGLLPTELPDLPGTRMAALYAPADAGVVGGDFYDAFAVGDTTVLVIGDVSGKGASAAAVTAMTRNTIRTASLSSPSPTPAELLDTLNRAMLLGATDDEVEHYCTVLVITARPVDEGLSLCVATAGHPPPVRLTAGPPTRLDAGAGPPAGVFAEACYEQRSELLAWGEAMVLFTDGFTEARTRSGMLGPEGLAAALEGLAAEGVDSIAEALRGIIASDRVEVRDDAAALVVQAVQDRGARGW
jgi:sigma-B regulation protein RsbU (phosphoserine phosphatase)